MSELILDFILGLVVVGLLIVFVAVATSLCGAPFWIAQVIYWLLGISLAMWGVYLFFPLVAAT